MSACLQYMRAQNLNALIPCVQLTPSICLISELWAGVEMLNMKKEKMKKFKRHYFFLIFHPPSLPLHNPLSGFTSKSNLAHVSILSPPPHLSLFFLVLHPFLLPFLSPSFTPSFPPFPSSPLPLPAIPSLYLSVATWKATCALIARGEGGQRVN